MRRRAMALVTVLLVMAVVALCLFAGVQVTSKNLLFLSGVHRANLALAAAEAGVYGAIAQLEQVPDFAGPWQGTLRNGCSFHVSLTRGPGTRVGLLSRGTDGYAYRTLQVTLDLTTDSFPRRTGRGRGHRLRQRHPQHAQSLARQG